MDPIMCNILHYDLMLKDFENKISIYQDTTSKRYY